MRKLGRRGGREHACKRSRWPFRYGQVAGSEIYVGAKLARGSGLRAATCARTPNTAFLAGRGAPLASEFLPSAANATPLRPPVEASVQYLSILSARHPRQAPPPPERLWWEREYIDYTTSMITD